MANKFLNGIEVSSSAVVDGGSLSTGSTVLDVQGSQGQLFSVTNSLVGDLFSVSDISGVPILNVNSNGNVDIDGKLGINNNVPAYSLDLDLDSVNDRINITAGGAQKAIINGYGNIIAYGSLTSYNNSLGGGGGIFTYKGGTATQTIGHRFQHVSGNFTGSSGDQTMMQVNPTINQTSTAGYTGIKLNVTETATGSGTKNLLDLQVGGTSKASISNTGNATFAGSITTNLSSEGTYFTGGSGGLRQLSITSGTNTSAHALHTFNISSSNGKYEFDVNGTTELSLDSSSATFAGNIVMATNATVDGVDISGLPTSFAPTDAEANVQADWTETTTTSDAFILNKPTTFAPSAHNHDDRYYTETESNSLYTRKYTFSPGSNASNNRIYVKLFTLGNFDVSVVGKLASAGDYGDSDRATYEIQIATRSNISFDVYQLSTDAVSDDYEFYYKTVGSTYEIWCKMSDYNQDNTFTKLSDYGSPTYNFDSQTTTQPTGLTAVTKAKIYHEGHLPTLIELGAQATGNYITGTGSLSAQDLTDIGNLSGTNTGDQTNILGNSATTTLATDSSKLGGYTLAQIDHAEAFHTFDNIDASATQAKRYHIGRLYGCPAHWDANWQNIEFNVTAESYESGHLRYKLMGDYGGSGTQANMMDLYLKEASGSIVGRFRFVLGTPVDAGWDHSGQDTFYVDLYAEASYYSQWKINIKTYGHGTQNTNPTSGGATTVFYDTPTVTNISTFNETHLAIHHLENEIYHEGHKPTLAELGAAADTVVNQTDFVSAANGGTFGGNLTIKHATSPTLTLTDDSPDPDNIGKIDVANTYMTFALDSTDGIDSSRMRFQLDGANIIEVLPNTTYFRQTNIHLQNTSTSSVSFRKDAAIEAGDDLGKINFIATNDEGTTYVTGGNIIYEGDGTWDLSTINNAPTRMKIQLRDSSGTLANAMMLSSNLNANFYGDLTVAGNLTVSGTTTTLNTETVEVKDNILQLNTTQGSPNTATAATSGISVFRGLDSNGNDTITQASLIFDEGDDIWDLTNNLTVAGDVIGASFAVPSGASTGFLKADGSVDGTTYSGYNFGATDLAFQGADPGDIVWKDAEGTEVHRIWSGSTDYLTYRNDAGTTYELISAGSTSYNNSNWDTAYTHSQAAHAPTNAEANVQADWNETSTTSDAFILNKLTDYVSAASGGTFSGDLTINADLTINGSTDGNGAVTPRILDFTTNPTNAGLAGSSGYQIGEISFTGKDSSSNAAGKYGRIRGSIVDSNTTVQGSGGEGGKLQFTLLKHDVGAQPRVEYDILTLDPLVAEVDGQLEVTGNIQLTGGGTIEAPSVNGGEDLILKAAGGVDVIIDSNGNGGDNEIFRVMHHTSAVLFEVQEGGEVRFQDGIRISGIEDRISSVGSSMYIGGGGFGNSLVQFSGKPIPDSNYYFDFGASNRYWNHCYLGTIHLGSTLLSNQLNTNIDASTSPELVGQVAIATYTAAFFDFVVKKGTNIRSGTVYACHDGTNVEFTETSTNDLGNTSDVTLSVDISGANMRLLATVTSDDWSVKSLIRAI